MIPSTKRKQTTAALCGWLALLAATPLPANEGAPAAWWNQEWQVRKDITLRSGGTVIDGQVPVLLRFHEGNFQFGAMRPDGGDLRFVAEDGETVLPHRIERIDTLMNEALVWVAVPGMPEEGEVRISAYYGNANAPSPDSAPVFGEEARMVLQFSGRGVATEDASGTGNAAAESGTATSGALIGGGLRFFGNNGIEIPASESLEFAAVTPATYSLWVRPTIRDGRANILQRSGESGDELVLGLDGGVPFVEVARGGQRARENAPAALADGFWRHLAVVANESEVRLYVDGEPAARVEGGLPALGGPIWIGGPPASYPAIVGEVDEIRVIAAAVAPAVLAFEHANQSGSEAGMRLITVGADETAGAKASHNETLEHVMLFGDIAKNMMFDGWIAVGVCVLMIFAGWTVAFQKFNYLNRIEKGSRAFLELWKKVSHDLTVLDHGDKEKVKSLGGSMSKKTAKHISRSPIYHLYHIGSEEINHRIGEGRINKGLSARSIQAIRAALEAGMVRENQRMNSKLVFLTISIAGGPYVGLLGTVVGVMITFALIAKTGEVEVNSIAPGIASALLATTAGLVVAIPALFMYSYLSTRIKNVVADMQVFIDEFVAKMAEFYPPPSESGAYAASPSPVHVGSPPEAPGSGSAGMAVIEHATRES